MLSRLHFRNEWRLLAKYPLFWIILAGVAGFSLLVANGSPARPGSTAAEALLRLNLFIPSFMLPFIAGALGPIFYMREVDYDMADMIGAYPITLRDWLAMRCGNFALLLCAICLVAQLMFLAVLGPQYDGALAGVVASSAFWLLVLHLPSCLLWAGALAWLACHKANSGFLYLAAGLGWLAYLGVATLTGSPLIAGSEAVWPMLTQAMLVFDPYAATALTNPVPETGLLQSRWFNIGLGRIFWIGIALFAISRIDQLPNLVGRQASSEKRNIRTVRANSIGHFQFHLRYFVRDRIFFLIILGWFALLLPEVYGGMDYVEPLSVISPDSRDALNRVVWDVLPLAGALLMLYAADRICRLYPATRMHELYAATPHISRRLIAVQLACLSAIAIFFTILAGLAVLLAQILAGSPIQPGEYFLQLGLSFSELFLFAAIFTAVHGMVRLRFLANLACLVILLFSLSSLAPAIGLYHPLWKPFNTPLVAPDHIWGFAGGLAGHFAYMLFWIPIVLMMLILAIIWGNRTLSSSQVRLKSVVGNSLVPVALICLCMAVWQGVAIDYSLRNENALVTPGEQMRRRADYERNYQHWERVAQPEVEAVKTRVDFYPAEHRAGIHAAMQLVNRSGKPITEILVGRGAMTGNGKIMLNRASTRSRDTRLDQTVFKLKTSLRPGEQLQMRFDLDLAKSVLQPAVFPLALRPEFSSLPVHALLPVVGFKRALTLRDPVARKEQGLPELQRALPSRLASAPSGSWARENIMLDSVISTESGQYAVGQGVLVRRWEEGGRSFFHYRTSQPIRNLPAYLSVPWRPQSSLAGPYNLNIYAPKQLAEDDPNILAMRDTLALFDSNVAPYPGGSLHLLAVPDTGPGGYALPQIIQISNRLGLRAKPQSDAGFDQRYRRAVHETAHQWFGHLLGYGNIEERAFLVESLAKYAELILIEQRYGKKAMLALVVFERDRYRHARLDPAQSTALLIDAEENEDMYSRATLAFACLRQGVGDKPVLAALRHLAERQREDGRAATSLGFIAALKERSAKKSWPMIDQLFTGSEPIDKVREQYGCNLRGVET